MQVGGIILCGGQSQRMGADKARLAFGPETMLERMVRLVGEVVSPVVVVTAAGQTLPPLPAEVQLATDSHADRGPLEGIAAGLAALPDTVEAAYITGCDVPLLEPAFVRRLIDLLGDYDAVVPEIGGWLHPLCAVYRRRILPYVSMLLAEDRLRVQTLCEQIVTRRATAEELTAADPQLLSLRNVNHPDDYRQALALAGFRAE